MSIGESYVPVLAGVLEKLKEKTFPWSLTSKKLSVRKLFSQVLLSLLGKFICSYSLL